MTLQSTGNIESDEIRQLGPWFHNLHLPDGRQTAPDHPLGDFPAYKWAQIGPELPVDMAGCRVLDIGCNAGFYSFELAKRGADVLAIDHDPHYLSQATWALGQMGLADRVEVRRMSVYELADLLDTFDIVLFLGVLYHLRHPLLGLDLVARLVDRTLVLQTVTMPGGDPRGCTPPDITIDQRVLTRRKDWPVMAFVENSMADDHTNWWVPSSGAVEAMVRSTGLRVISRPGHELWICARAQPRRDDDETELATRAWRTIEGSWLHGR